MTLEEPIPYNFHNLIANVCLQDGRRGRVRLSHWNQIHWGNERWHVRFNILTVITLPIYMNICTVYSSILLIDPL